MTNYRALFAILSFIWFIQACSDNSTLTIRSSDYDLGKAVDCTPVMLQMIRAAEGRKAKIIIEKGVYHFYPDKAFEKYCHITNHDDGLRNTPFPIIGCKDLEIAAEGAEFIFHGIMLPFMIEGSENIKLSGFSIDWEIPLHSEVDVVAVNEVRHTFDIEIREDTPYEIRNGELIFLKEGYEHNLERAICWDPQTMAIAYNTWVITPLMLSRPIPARFTETIQFEIPEGLGTRFLYKGVENSLIAKELKPGLVRLSGHTKGLPSPGHIIVAKGRNRFNRFAPAIHIHSSKSVEINEVTVHHAGGMGLVAERSEDLHMNGFNVALREGSGRMLTTTADATHFNNCRGLLRMENCLFENMLDDGTNIHGIYMIVEDVLDERTIGMACGHFQQLGFEFAKPGERMGFIKVDSSLLPFAEAIVASVEKVNKRYFIVQFEKALDAGIRSGHLIDNLDWYPEVELVNNTVRNNRARGFLISSPRKSLCQGNFFSNMDEAITLHAGFGGYWYEAGFATDLVIRDNVFADCVYAGRERAVIDFHCAPSVDPYVFSKIIIEENEFRTFDPMIMNPERVDSLIIRNNNISRSAKYPPLFKDNPMIQVSATNYLLFEGNNIDGFTKEDIAVDRSSNEGFHSSDNSWNPN